MLLALITTFCFLTPGADSQNLSPSSVALAEGPNLASPARLAALTPTATNSGANPQQHPSPYPPQGAEATRPPSTHSTATASTDTNSQPQSGLSPSATSAVTSSNNSSSSSLSQSISGGDKGANSNHKRRNPKAYSTPLGVGIGAGVTSGIGLSLRKHFDSRWGFHTGAIAFGGDKYLWGNVGAQAMYTFKRTRFLRLYALLGSTIFVNINEEQRAIKVPETMGSPSYPGQYIRKTVVDSNLTVGAGIGLEMHFTPHFGWAIELPLGFAFDLNPAADHDLFEDNVSFRPIPSTALSFYF